MGACCKSCALAKPCESTCGSKLGAACPLPPYPGAMMNQPAGMPPRPGGMVAGPNGFLAPNMGVAPGLGIGGFPSMNPMHTHAPAGQVSYVATQMQAQDRLVQPQYVALPTQQTDVALPLGAAYMRAGGNPANVAQMAALRGMNRKSDTMGSLFPMGGVGVMAVPCGAGGFTAVADGLPPIVAFAKPVFGNFGVVNPSGATKDEVGGDSSDPTIARRPSNFTEADWAKLTQADRQKLLDTANAATLQAVSDGLKTGLGAASSIIQSVITSNDSAARDRLNLEIAKLKNNADIQLAQINAKRDTDLATINAQVQAQVANGQITATQAFDLMKQAQALQNGQPGFLDTTAGKVTLAVGAVAVAGGVYWLATRNDGARKNPEPRKNNTVEYTHTDYFQRTAPRRKSAKRR